MCETVSILIIYPSILFTQGDIPPAQLPLGCQHCAFRTGNNDKLLRHLRTHTNERPFSCPMCDKHFSQSHHLKNHVMVVHAPVKTAHKCPLCPRKYRRRSDLYVHMRHRHPFVERHEHPPIIVPLDDNENGASITAPNGIMNGPSPPSALPQQRVIVPKPAIPRSIDDIHVSMDDDDIDEMDEDDGFEDDRGMPSPMVARGAVTAGGGGVIVSTPGGGGGNIVVKRLVHGGGNVIIKRPANAGLVSPSTAATWNASAMATSGENGFIRTDSSYISPGNGMGNNNGGASSASKRRRCGTCGPCLIKESCGECQQCKNRATARQICKLRKCIYLRGGNGKPRK